MGDTWNDARQEYETGGSSTTITEITNISNEDLLTIPTTSDANNLIKLVNSILNINDLYILQANQGGEIRFLTLNAKNANDQSGNLLYNTKIDANGNLNYYHSFTIFNPAKFSGWYSVDGSFSSVENQLTILDVQIATLTGASLAAANQITTLQTELGATAGLLNSTIGGITILETEVNAINTRLNFQTTPLRPSAAEQAAGEASVLNLSDAMAAYDDAAEPIAQVSRAVATSRYSVLALSFTNNLASAVVGIAFVGGVYALIRQILDEKKKEKYEFEILGISETLSKIVISTTQDKLIHTGITIVSGNTGFLTGNTTYSIGIQRSARLVIYINSSFVASIINVEEVGTSTFTIGETIIITKTQLGGGTGGNLVLSVAELGTFKQWTELRIDYLREKITGIKTKARRKGGVIGADDIDTTQFTTTDVSYTDITDPINETITYKQLKSRLNLLPTGASDVDVYTSTGKIGVGTTPETQIHTYDAVNNIMRLGTAVNGEVSIQFKRGIDTDVYTDWRLRSASGRFELQYENDVLGYGNTGTDIFYATTSLFGISKNTQIEGNVGIGTSAETPLHTYHATNNILRIATGTGATDKTQIQFIKGTLTDTGTDFRLISEITLFKLQYQDQVSAFGATGTDLITARATSITIHKNTTLSANVGIGGVNPHATYKVNVGGDVNISAGSFYRINGVQLSYNNLIDKLVAGNKITIDPLTNVISAIVPDPNNILSEITSGTLAVAYGGTGANDIGAGGIPFGNATESAYSWATNFKYDAPNGRLAVGLINPAYTIDVGGDINISTGSVYRSNGTALSYNDLTNKLTAGTNITITSGVIDAIVPAQLTAGTGITITSGAINADTQLTAGNNIQIVGGVIDAIVPAQLTAGNNITITSGAINAIVPAQLTAGTNITITSGAINAIVPTTFNASAITAGTLPVSRGGTGLGVVSAGVIPFGNSTSDAYTWRVLLKWDDTNFRLGVNKGTPLYTIDTGGDINIPTGSVYRINGNALALDNLSGTLPISKGGTGGASIGAGAIPIGNSLQTAYTWTNLLKYDLTNFRLSVGVATPLYALDVAGSVNISTGNSYRVAGNPISFTNIAGTASVSQGGTGASTFTSGNILYGSGTSAISSSTNLKFEGTKLGVVMTGTPIANLHIGTGTLSTGGTYYTWFDYSSGGIGFTNSARTDVCAYFQGSLWLAGGRFLASSSDTRIKKEIEDINDDSALSMILAVEPKTYKYIDEVALGNKRVYGFIAQQIRQVIPEAINLQKERIPNVLLLGTYNNTIITLPSQPTKVVIKVGDKLKCYDSENKEIEAFVEEVIDTLTFRIKELEQPYTDNKIFIYGTEIDDFHTIDKNYIYTLNVCATQELHRKIVSQEARIQELEAKVERLLNYLT